jgi:DNA-binding transcriptional MocR family regulator
MVSQAIVYEFCRSGAIDASIETVKLALAERAKALCSALRRELPDARFHEPEGGYFLWLDLPRGTDGAALYEAAMARGVQFVKGSDFVLEGATDSLRLAYAGVTSAEIEEGVSRLADAYSEIISR